MKLVVKSYIEKNMFMDSVFLMKISSKVREVEGIEGAEAIVGTEHNKGFLESGGLLTDEIKEEAGANDLIIAVKAADEQTAESGIETALNELKQKNSRNEDLFGEYVPKTFDSAIEMLPDANLGILSIPGEYVEREANKILDAGMHLMIFSDNVPLETEVALKERGQEQGLLVMGPDCGTAIINGAPLAFANEINSGKIGIVAAAGTGLQEVSALIHKFGEGITQGIGTGGRDVKKSVGGKTVIQGMKALMADDNTEVIVIVSKPPEESVAKDILEVASQSTKPVVVNFVGGDPDEINKYDNCEPATTIKEAAHKAVDLVKGKAPGKVVDEISEQEVSTQKSKLSSGQKYLRGLYSGGTLAFEAMNILEKELGGIYSNIALVDQYELADSFVSKEHTIVDLGEDEFTKGKPHPMIDPGTRNERIVQEAKDPETAVMLLDVVIGYGSHEDPAGQAVKAIKEAKEIASKEGREIVFVASVCGTDGDPQGYQEQVSKLKGAGVNVLPSNVEAVKFAFKTLV